MAERRSADQRNQRKKRARARRKRRLVIVLLSGVLCCLILSAAVLFVRKFFPVEEAAVVYEQANYNRGLVESELFSKDLCVASADVSLAGAPATDGIGAFGLFDVGGARVGGSYNIHSRLFPASTTKIMTALVALENADLSERVTVREDAVNFAADEQVCGLEAGDTLILGDLLYGLLLHSGNDNAAAIADHIAGNQQNFADMMNVRAQELMATNTHFSNPSGLHEEDHYTTAYDLYLIFNECIKNDTFVQMIQSDSYTADITGADGSARQVTWTPSHYYAQGMASPPEGADVLGGKTGTTDEAGNCLILLNYDSSGNPYISVVMGADSKELLYQDMTAVINTIPTVSKTQGDASEEAADE